MNSPQWFKVLSIVGLIVIGAGISIHKGSWVPVILAVAAIILL